MLRRTEVVVAAVIVAAIVVIAGVLYLSPASRRGPPPGTPITNPGPPAISGTVANCSEPGFSAAGGNSTTYHGDNTRTGDFAGGPFHHAVARWSAPVALDGAVYAAPLVCDGTVFVVTETNSVYAINATNGSVAWRTDLGSPVPGKALPCGDIDPSGITGTPVIDVTNASLYAVAYQAGPGSFHHELFDLSTSNGSVRSQIDVDPPGANVTALQERGALALSRGVVYIPYGGLAGDCANYHGYVVGVREDHSGGPLTYRVPTHREGGIWTPGGISVAPSGNLYVSTGNGDSTTTYDYGDAVIELSPTLGVVGYFAPKGWATLNQHDTDLGSTPPVLLPNGDVFQIGKAGEGYVLSATALGGIGGQLGENPVCHGAYGGSAHVGTTVLVACVDGVVAVDVGATNLTVTWRTTSFDAGAPIVTGNVVWAVDTGASTIRGFDLTTGAQLLTLPIGASEHFETPAAGPGYVVVAGGDQLYAFNLS